MCSKGLQSYFDNMSSIFNGCFIGVARVFVGVARVLHFCFKGDSRVFELFFEEVNSNVVPGCFRDVLVLLLF